MSNAASRKDLADLGAHTPESPRSTGPSWQTRQERRRQNLFPGDQRHLKFSASTRYFVTIGTAIALVSLVWIAYGTRRNSVDGSAIVAGCATVLVLLLAWLTNLTKKRDKSPVETSARVAEAGHIGSASNYLSAESSPSRLGALYVLEQIGIESRESAASVLNSLLIFIRSKTSLKMAESPSDNIASTRVTDDVQTALAILGRLRTIGQLPLELRIDLSWCNLSGARLRGWDFSGIDLHRSILDDADLSNSNFDNANLPYCTLKRARIVGASFKWSIMFHADLSDSLVIGCDFTNAMLARAILERAQIHSSRFENAILSDARAKDARLIEVDFRDATMTGVEGADVSSDEVAASHADEAAARKG